MASITTVTPAVGTTAGGTSVTITVTPAAVTVTAVKFGTTSATTLSVTGGKIKCKTPAHAAGKVAVKCTWKAA